jgi:hypothetical protein
MEFPTYPRARDRWCKTSCLPKPLLVFGKPLQLAAKCNKTDVDSSRPIDGQLRQRPVGTAVRGRQQGPLANTPFDARAVGVGSTCGAYWCRLGVRQVPRRPPQSASVSGAAFRDPPRALRSDRRRRPAFVARRIGPRAHAKRPALHDTVLTLADQKSLMANMAKHCA